MWSSMEASLRRAISSAGVSCSLTTSCCLSEASSSWMSQLITSSLRLICDWKMKKKILSSEFAQTLNSSWLRAARYLEAAEMVLFSKRLTARRRALLAARPDTETFLFLPEGTLLMAADPFQLLLHTHSGPPTLTRTQLLLHSAAWTLLLEMTATDMFKEHQQPTQLKSVSQKTHRLSNETVIKYFLYFIIIYIYYLIILYSLDQHALYFFMPLLLQTVEIIIMTKIVVVKQPCNHHLWKWG